MDDADNKTFAATAVAAVNNTAFAAWRRRSETARRLTFDVGVEERETVSARRVVGVARLRVPVSDAAGRSVRARAGVATAPVESADLSADAVAALRVGAVAVPLRHTRKLAQIVAAPAPVRALEPASVAEPSVVSRKVAGRRRDASRLIARRTFGAVATERVRRRTVAAGAAERLDSAVSPASLRSARAQRTLPQRPPNYQKLKVRRIR